MEIFPAIDLQGGKVVRLEQGDFKRRKTYGQDVQKIIDAFTTAGVKWVHVVDVDAARSGQRCNAELIRNICRSKEIKVQLGGGIRDDQAVKDAFELGVDRLVIGSAAVKNWQWFEKLARQGELSGRIMLGIDARRGRLAVNGWTGQTGISVMDIVNRSRSLPLAGIIYTDIERDGMLTGPDLETTAEIIKATSLPVIASGGIRNVDDIDKCKQIGCQGVIIGKAYYEGMIDLESAVVVARVEKKF